MNDKYLTVIVPAYNMEGYLADCCSSLLAAGPRLEVLVVNDGSTDGTSKIAHDYAAQYPEIFKVIDKPNGHYGSCVNAGLSIAHGKYVKILDADDTFDGGILPEFLDFLAARDVDLVFSDYLYVDTAGRTTGRVMYSYSTDVDIPFEEFTKRNPQMAMHAMTYRIAMLRQIGYRQMEGAPYTDTEWFFTPMAAVETVAYFGKPVYRYLLGRADQSMAPKVVAANVSRLVGVLRRLVEVFKNLDGGLDRAHRDYLNGQLQRMVVTIAATIIDVVPFWSVGGMYREFTAYLIRELPHVSVRTRRAALFRSSRRPFYYADFCRRHQIFILPCLAFLRGYRFFTSRYDRLRVIGGDVEKIRGSD